MAEAAAMDRAVLRALRPHHWVKNLLVFVPILAAHRWGEAALWAGAGMAFAAFCLCSSAVYLANDLMDLADDRAHPVKRHRPLASGQLSPPFALVLAGLCLLAAAPLALASGTALWLAAYVGLSVAYSLWLKRLAGVDVLCLVGLYVLRLLVGGASTGIEVSLWLVGYGAAVFASLALAKRVAELRGAALGTLPLPARRGYRPAHQAALTVAGLAAAAGSALVLALYLALDEGAELYARPLWLVTGGVLVLAWLVRVWGLVRRGLLQSDPIVFALRDPVSVVAGLAVLALFRMAAG